MKEFYSNDNVIKAELLAKPSRLHLNINKIHDKAMVFTTNTRTHQSYKSLDARRINYHLMMTSQFRITRSFRSYNMPLN